jgi:transposase-like protein/IS1 family transposase
MSCPARGQSGEGNIVIHSRQEARYKCKECGQTFAASTGTPFYRLRHSVELVTTVVTLLAHGCPIQAIVAAFGLDERTVSAWQKRAGQHCQEVHEHLVEQPRDLEHVQADEIWVKVQGHVVWLAMALMVRTRLWLGGVVSPQRDERLIVHLIQLVRRSALARPLLFCVDGYRAYVSAVQRVFRTPVPNGKQGRPRLVPWPDIVIGRVIKRYQTKRVVAIVRQMAQGAQERAAALLEQSQGGQQLNTAFIERLNATFRSRLATLGRRTRSLARLDETLQAGIYLIGCVYNFCTNHKSLRVPGIIGGYRKWLPRTPAMAAGITDHRWTVKELLLFKVPLPGWIPPKRRGQRSKETKALIARWCT